MSLLPDILVVIASQDDPGGSASHICLSPQDVANLQGFRNQRVIVEVTSSGATGRHRFYLADVLLCGRESDNEAGWWVPLNRELKSV